jgi:hypothetical protein
MAKKRQPKSLLDVALDHAQWRQEHQERVFRDMNKAAARSIGANAAVIGRGAIDNATKGLAASSQRQRRGRR